MRNNKYIKPAVVALGIAFSLATTVFSPALTTIVKADVNVIEEYLNSLKNKYSGGDGTQANPYKISTVDDLMLMRNDSDRNGSYGPDTPTYFELTNDIVFNSDYSNYKSWGNSAPANKLDCPIDEQGFSYRFRYAFLDGNGYTIYGLYGEGNSLFGSTENTTVKNINFSNFYMKNTPLIAVSISDSTYESINATNGVSVFKNRDYSNLWGNDSGGLFDNANYTKNSTSYLKSINVNMDMSADNGAYYIGMISGQGGEFKDCSTAGKLTIDVNKKRDVDNYSFSAGCIAGSGIGSWDNCINKASVVINLPADKDTVGFFGGIVGNMANMVDSSDTVKIIKGVKLSNCSNEGSIKVNTKYNVSVAKKQKGLRQSVYIAGIVSSMPGGEISNCTNKGSISTSYCYYNAGIVNNALDNCKISNCLNEGNITTVATTGLAGICNTTSGNITHCENRGDLKTTEKLVDKNTFFVGCSVSGIVGVVEVENDDTVISYCKNTGHISAYDTALWASTSGIAASFKQYEKKTYKGVVKNCVNTGFIEGGMVSGIVNTSGTYKHYNNKGRNVIKNCINAGNLRQNYADDRICGIVFSSCYTDITNCFNTGTITKKTYKNGTARSCQLVGLNNEGSIINNCYIIKSSKDIYKSTGYNQNGGKTKKVTRLSKASIKKMSLYKSIMANAGV